MSAPGRGHRQDAPVIACAVAATAAAYLGPGLPVWLLAVVVLLGALPAALRTLGSHVGRGSLAADARWLDRAVAGVAAGAALVALVGLRSAQDTAGLRAALPSHIEGTAELASDPETSELGTEAEVVAEGRRFRARFPRSVEPALEGMRSGDRLRLRARVRPFRDAPEGWVRSRHLAGGLEVAEAAPARGTRPWFSVANRVHDLLERGSASMGSEHRSLYLGLVVGDDRGQSELTRFRFRASGLTHLLAVSGQNLAFVLVLLAPLGRRMGMRSRWVLGLAAMAGFVVVTRAEPSVLRAATMAGLALSANLSGRQVSGARLLGLAVMVLLVGDPMLVHSVGFRLSVAATAGLVVLAEPIRARLPGPGWLRLPLAVTLAAQAGAVPVMTATFGPASLVSVPANVLAEPAAGAVMTLGMSSGILSGVLREEVAWVLQIPVRAGVWWVDEVATRASQLAVPPLGLGGWVCVAVCTAVAVWLARGAHRGAPGRAMVLAVLPLLVLVRPGSAPVTDQPVWASSDYGTVQLSLESLCGQWVLVAAGVPASAGGGRDGPGAGRTSSVELGEAAVAGVVEELWRIGVATVRWVVVWSESSSETSGGAGFGIEALAGQLRAEVVHRHSGATAARAPDPAGRCVAV